MLWHAPGFRFSRHHRHTNEQYECAYADQRNRRRRQLTRFSDCRWHGRVGVQQDRFGFSRHPKLTDRSPISEAGGPIKIVGPDFAGKDFVAKNLLFKFSHHRAFARHVKSHRSSTVTKSSSYREHKTCGCLKTWADRESRESDSVCASSAGWRGPARSVVAIRRQRSAPKHL